MPKQTVPYDVIVVGSGASGGWAAKRLAEAGVNVALVEAGRAHNPGESYKHVQPHQLPYANLSRERLRKTHDVANLFVMDAASFPSGGCQNPTLTIMAMAVRSPTT